MKELTCEELLQYLSDFIDNQLDEALAEPALYHLATCQNCKVVLNTTQKTIDLMGETIRRSIPAGRRQRLFEDLEQTFLNSEKM
ncbi:MAG: zf-HC2 domain-containing protein [Ardenticatenaceae bacterium]|nr:zf-HC2 domain-containing protein [Ardenticatenaceae bacterium]